MAFKDWINQYMKENKITIPEMTELTGLCKVSVERYKYGKSTPSFSLAEEVLDALGYEIVIRKKGDK